jgi:coenzyme F420 hydrogenase subunit beta
MKSTVITEIVEKNLCIGCGLCAVICPSHSLEMEWNLHGEYNPVKKMSCDKECGMCLKVCPFANGNENEDCIGTSLFGSIPRMCHLPQTGYYADTYAGYAPETREQGTSGGMATWLLSGLLKKGIVEYVVAVVPNDDPDLLFRYAVLTDSKSVLDSSGSVYYPVELSGVLRQILDKSGKCAIVGLPCFIKAVRLAAQKNKKLRDRIFVTVGLVCGQYKSKHYTEYLSALSGVHEPLANVIFRKKDPKKPANNYYFSCTGTEGDKGKVFWNDGASEAWVNRWFTQNACNYCDDVFAECADVTFMDAWLPEYVQDYRGTSLVLVRSARMQDVMCEGIRSEEIHLKTIAVQKLIKSQSSGIEEKRIILAHRLYQNKIKGMFSPQKRIQPMKITNPFQKKKLLIIHQMQCTSRNLWAETRDKEFFGMEKFRGQMNTYLDQVSRWNRIERICQVPLQYLLKTRKKIRSFFV